MAQLWQAAVTVALSEINWSTGTEADMEGEDTDGEPRKVAAISLGIEIETAVILEKRESWHRREMH